MLHLHTVSFTVTYPKFGSTESPSHKVVQFLIHYEQILSPNNESNEEHILALDIKVPHVHCANTHSTLLEQLLQTALALPKQYTKGLCISKRLGAKGQV